MIIIGIDPGTACGWAVYDTNLGWTSGVWDLKSRRHEGGGMRFLRLRGYFGELLTIAGDVGAVFYEEVRRHMGTDAAHVYGGIVAVITEECEARVPKTPYMGIPVGTVKKLATGKGNAGKPAMIEAALARWPGFKPADDNEVDARWIAVAGEAELRLTHDRLREVGDE
jgi:Holliday junction resolvasome RuvABC endonuclease subunit